MQNLYLDVQSSHSGDFLKVSIRKKNDSHQLIVLGFTTPILRGCHKRGLEIVFHVTTVFHLSYLDSSRFPLSHEPRM